MGSSAENVLLFDLIFSIMLFAFGVSTGAANIAVFQTVPVPQLAPQPGVINCSQYDFTCNASKGIAQATAYIGWAIVNLPVLLIFFLGIFILFANVVLGVTFSPSFSGNGVPYLGIFFSGLQLYIVWEIIRTIRGNSTAGV